MSESSPSDPLETAAIDPQFRATGNPAHRRGFVGDKTLRGIDGHKVEAALGQNHKGSRLLPNDDLAEWLVTGLEVPDPL
jgi:hypothetical protein